MNEDNLDLNKQTFFITYQSAGKTLKGFMDWII